MEAAAGGVIEMSDKPTPLDDLLDDLQRRIHKVEAGDVLPRGELAKWIEPLVEALARWCGELAKWIEPLVEALATGRDDDIPLALRAAVVFTHDNRRSGGLEEFTKLSELTRVKYEAVANMAIALAIERDRKVTMKVISGWREGLRRARQRGLIDFA